MHPTNARSCPCEAGLGNGSWDPTRTYAGVNWTHRCLSHLFGPARGQLCKSYDISSFTIKWTQASQPLSSFPLVVRPPRPKVASDDLFDGENLVTILPAKRTRNAGIEDGRPFKWPAVPRRQP